MKLSQLLLLPALALAGLGAAQAQMKFAVNNQNSSVYADDQVWVLFFSSSMQGSYVDATSGSTVSITPTSIGTGNTYAINLADVAVDAATGHRTFDITTLAGGSQMWFNYGSSPVSFENGAPAVNDTSAAGIGNFNKRWQFIEPNVTSSVISGTTVSGINVDQTIIDSFSIPIQIQANSAPHTKAGAPITNNNQFNSPTQAIVQALANASVSPSTYPNIYSTSPQGGPIVNPTSLPDANFVRAASPTQTGTTVYHDWTPYMNALESGGALNPSGTATIRVSGSFNASAAGSGNGFETQTYDMKVTFTGSTMVMTGTTFKDAAMTEVLIDGITITSTYDDLNTPAGIYGNAADFDWTSVTPMTSFDDSSLATSGSENAGANDVLGWMMGDILAGMTMGFPGSAFGSDNSSSEWFLHPELAFQNAQTNPLYYDTWAAALWQLTSSYAMGYEDRFGQNLLAFANGAGLPGFNSVDGAFLQINILPDAIPEPTALALLGLGGLAVLSRRRRR